MNILHLEQSSGAIKDTEGVGELTKQWIAVHFNFSVKQSFFVL